MDSRAPTAPVWNRSAVGTVRTTTTDRPETLKIDMQSYLAEPIPIELCIIVITLNNIST